VLPLPVEPPQSLLYQEPEPLPDLDVDRATVVDLVKRIHELTARYSTSLIEHRGLSRFALGEYTQYKQFYVKQGNDHER
jgi:hypothetical protein